MIIMKIWTTEKRKPFGFIYERTSYSCRSRHWKGWFLFGIIPLYVANVKTVYSR